MGLVPLKTESGARPEAAGAGAGQVSGSGASPTRLVGLNVPVTKVAPVMLAAAASSRVRVIPATSPPPPTSDMMTAFCPAGPTSNRSRSPGKVWVKPFSFTVTFKTVPDRPLTTMFEGYGVAAPWVVPGCPAGDRMFVVFVNVSTQPGVTVGVGVGVSVGVGVGVGVAGVGVGVAGVGVGVAGVGVGVAGVGVGVAGVGVGVGVAGVGVGVGAAGVVVGVGVGVVSGQTCKLTSSTT